MNRFSVVLIKSFFIIVSLWLVPRDSWTAKEKHQYFLQNSPFKHTKNLTKNERRAQGLPPNTFNERAFELTMNPRLGYPTPEKLQRVQQALQAARKNKSPKELTARAPGETASNSWQSLGPNNVGGRTRAALFDLSDTDKDKVFAGGVSGGLWVHQDIDNPSEVSWSKVNGVPGNLAVTVIVQDKNEHNLLFAGTGESYTTGDAIGNGVYRSTDGGLNWTMVLGTGTSSASTSSSTTGSPTTTTFWVDGNFYVNDMAFWDPTPSNTANDDEIIFAALGVAYNSNFDGANTSTFLGRDSYGLYKSTNKGATWTRFNTMVSTAGASLDDINDIEISSDNKIWVSTNRNIYTGSQSGRFYYSSDGTTFTLQNPTFPGIANKTNINRVEIEPSGQDSQTFYILLNNTSNNQADIYKTTDAFNTVVKIAEPIDGDTGDIPVTDFTRGQAFYDLEVEVDPTDDDIVYVGGINWYKSLDGGSTWNQMSDWNGTPADPYSTIHADQHGLYFRPGNNNQAVVVNDGGVAFVSNLASATTAKVFTIQEKDFITTQFYSVAQTPEGFATDFITGGTQDNGSHRIVNPAGVPTNSNEIQGGDGGYTYIDQVSPTYFITNYIYNNYIVRFDINNISSWTPLNNPGTADTDYNEGDFINPGALDSNLDILYVNASKGANKRIRRFKNLDTSPTDDYMPNVNAMLDDSPSAFEVSPYTTTSTLLMVGLDSGKLLKITDANGPAAAAVQIADNLGSISDIQFGTQEDKIFLTYYNYGVNNVFYSSDGGTNWTQKDGDLPDIPVWAIQHNPYNENEVIIATGLGIWQTDNFLENNPNWTQSYNGMSDVAVHDLQFRGSTALSNRVIAGSYGRGIFAGTFQDSTPPTVVLSSTDTDTIVVNTDAVTITATFSEAMAATPTLSISGLVSNVTLTGTNTTWVYVWNVGATSPTNGNYTATVSGQDLAGNAYTGTDSLTFVVSNTLSDTTPPTVVLSSTDTDTIVVNTDAVTITATFSEAMAATPTLSISGLVSNVTLTGTNTTWVYVWNVGATSPTNGNYTATVAGQDLAGNAYAGTDSLTFVVSNTLSDTTPPTVVLSSTDTDTIVVNTDVVTITATFSEAMAATPTLSISGLVSNVTLTGTNTTWVYVWNVGATSPTNGNYTATVAGQDLAGNAYAGIDSLTFVVSNTLSDTTPPTVVLSSTDTDTIVVNTDVVTIRATFSEAMAATPTLNISGLLSNVAMSGSNTIWIYQWNVGATSPTNGNYTATVAGQDLAGNAYAGTDSLTFVVSNTLSDTTPPTVVLSSTDTDTIVVNTDVVTIRATFSEAMAATPTLNISGLLSNVAMSGSNTIWTYQWNVGATSPTNGNYTATVAGQDLAGNAYAGTDSLTFVVSNTLSDTTPPTVVLSSTDTDTIVVNTDVVTIRATFSEAMAATPTLNISGLLSNVAMSGSNTIWTYQWNVGATSPTNGNYTATVAGQDLAGNAYAGTDSLTFVVSNTLSDTTPPTVVLSSTDTDTIVVNTDVVTIRATFSEAMAATPTLNISGLLSNVAMSGSNTIWIYQWNVGATSPTNGNYTATVAGQDLAGNAYAGTDSLTFTVSNTPPDTTAPIITGPTSGSHSDLNMVENYIHVGSFAANEAVNWSVTGSDQNEFQINGLGYLSFSGPKDFENPSDLDTNNRYDVIVNATDFSNNTGSHSISITLIDVDELVADVTPPIIRGPNGQQGANITISSNENLANLGTFQSNEVVSWLLSGQDATEFSINASGALVFNSGPDYESPTDTDGNNIYLFSVTAIDAATNSTTMNITLRVNDVSELAFNQIAGTGRYVYGILNPGNKSINNPTSSQYSGTDPITGAIAQRNTSMGSFNNQIIIVRNSNTDLGSMFHENVLKSPGQLMRYTGTVRNTATGASILVSGVVNGIRVYQIPPMGYLFHFLIDVTPDTPFGSPLTPSTQWATGILQFYISY